MSVMLSKSTWISWQSNRVSLSDVRDDLTPCKNSRLLSRSAPHLRVFSTNSLTASEKGSVLRPLSSCTRLVSLFLWHTRPPRAWPTADSLCTTLLASRCAPGRCGLALGVGDSCSSSMLLIDRVSSSSSGGESREEGLGGGSQTPSSIQDTLWGDAGAWLPVCCRSNTELLKAPGLEGEDGELPVLALWWLLEVLLGLRRTTPAEVDWGESADAALIRPTEKERIHFFFFF